MRRLGSHRRRPDLCLPHTSAESAPATARRHYPVALVIDDATRFEGGHVARPQNKSRSGRGKTATQFGHGEYGNAAGLTAGSPQDAAGARQKLRSGGHGAASDTVRQRAILELLTGRTFEAAAKKVGINERTLRKWATEDETFKAELKAAQKAMFEAGMSRIQGLTARAVDTFGELLEADPPPTVRLGAARSVLELGTHQHDAETIRQKLAEVEGYQRQQDAAGKR